MDDQHDAARPAADMNSNLAPAYLKARLVFGWDGVGGSLLYRDSLTQRKHRHIGQKSEKDS
jgi:hypothetical protein